MTLVHTTTRRLKAREGAAWYLGMFIIVAMLMMSILFIAKWRLELTGETIEDVSTSSALGAMDINAQQYALFKDTVFSSKAGSSGTNFCTGRVASPDNCFETIQDLIGANLNMERTPGTCSYSGYSSLIDSNTNPLTIKKAVFYNYYRTDGFIESFTYLPAENSVGYTCSYTANETNFPTGAVMDNSGIYLELDVPIEFLGRHITVTKSQWVAAKFNLTLHYSPTP